MLSLVSYIVGEKGEPVMLLFKTLTGSRLHGFHSEISDYDYVEVYTELPSTSHRTVRQTEHSITAEEDIMRLSLSHFLELASQGSHQILDAMYSTIPTVDYISGLRANFRGGSVVVTRLRGTIAELSQKDDVKKRRHAARIAVNLEQFMYEGYYQPTLTLEQKTVVLNLSKLPHEQFKIELQKMSSLQLDLPKR